MSEAELVAHILAEHPNDGAHADLDAWGRDAGRDEGDATADRQPMT